MLEQYGRVREVTIYVTGVEQDEYSWELRHTHPRTLETEVVGIRHLSTPPSSAPCRDF
jgi:hypothetical protein